MIASPGASKLKHLHTTTNYPFIDNDRQLPQKVKRETKQKLRKFWHSIEVIESEVFLNLNLFLNLHS